MSDGGNGFDNGSNRKEFGSRSNVKPGRLAQNDQDNQYNNINNNSNLPT